MSYQQLDFIADLYTPLLFVWVLLVLLKQIVAAGLRACMAEIGSLLTSLILVYSLMLIDNALMIWPKFNLDYSTHTALALALVSVFIFQGGKASWLAMVSLLLYCALMVYQKYHTVLDILLTALVVYPLFFAAHRWILHHFNPQSLNSNVED